MKNTPRIFIYGLIACLSIVISALFIPLSFSKRQTVSTSNKQKIGYVKNKECLGCHQSEAKEWMGSHHALAMTAASDQTIFGDFNNTKFIHQGIISHFIMHNNKYYIRTEGTDGKQAEFSIKYTIGSYPLQQYLIELPGGRLQNFTIAWDVAHKQWFHLYPKEKTPPGDVLHWTGRYQTGNLMCISCHTTNFDKNYEAATDSYATTWSEMNVSCQSCHGPGEGHVNWAKKQTKDSQKEKDDGLLVNFKTGDTRAIVETCAMCHSRRSELSPHPRAGQPFMDNYLPSLLHDGLYYPDGQQQGEVYAYGSFLQSKMYQKGVTCIDCHNPHTGKLKSKGNAVCTQCHQPQANNRFPSASGLFDSRSHHFHKMGSPGAQCVSCHMPSKNYMIIHSRPDHSIRIPRPDLSVKLGTPNACTNCHQNKTAQWAANTINQWYKSNRQEKIHYGEVLAAARVLDPKAENALIKIAGDPDEPAIVRATALYHLRSFGQQSLAASIEGINDYDPMIRYAALSGLERLLPAERVSIAAPLLKDPIRAVRIEAARVLSSVPFAQFSDAERITFRIALEEFVSAQNISLDMPGANLNLAVLNENLGNLDKANEYYLRALLLDPDFTPARLNLAQLYVKMQRYGDAEQILRDGIKRVPAQGQLHYSLGLLLAEEKNISEAVVALSRAVKLIPQNGHMRYNYALALQQLGERKKAEQQLILAQRTAPLDESILYALAIFYSQDHKWSQAIKWAEKLQHLHPNEPDIKQFLEELNLQKN